jgi:hypothetical protein
MASINLDISTQLDITCRRNDTFSLELTFSDDTGTAINLTTYSDFKMEVRKHDRKTGNPTLRFTKLTNEIIALSNGTMTVTGSAATMNVSGGDYVYDLQAITVGGQVYTWLRGKFVVNEDVTI